MQHPSLSSHPVDLTSRFFKQSSPVSAVVALALFLGTAVLHADDADAAKAAQVQTQIDIKEQRRADSIDRITRFMDMGTTINIERMLERHLESHPDDAEAYGQLSRIIMKLGIEPTDSLLGYRITEQADERAVAALSKALTLAPQNAEEHSRLGYLHAVQGRYEQAELAFDKVRQLNKSPAWMNYNEAILAVGLEQFTKAADLLDPLTDKRPNSDGNKPWNIYRSAWRLRKTLALTHPETDPVAAVGSGKMRRIPIDTLYDVATTASASGKPVLLFISSSDSGCGPCVTDLAGLSMTADALGEQYELVYTSIEPWNDIKKHSTTQRALKIKAVPAHVMMYIGQHLATVHGTLMPAMLERFQAAEPKILSGEHKPTAVKPYREFLAQDIHQKVKEAVAKKESFSAAAVAIDGREWTSGIVGGLATQAEADADAITRCERNVASKGLTTKCNPYPKE